MIINVLGRPINADFFNFSDSVPVEFASPYFVFADGDGGEALPQTKSASTTAPLYLLQNIAKLKEKFKGVETNHGGNIASAFLTIYPSDESFKPIKISIDLPGEELVNPAQLFGVKNKHDRDFDSYKVIYQKYREDNFKIDHAQVLNAAIESKTPEKRAGRVQHSCSHHNCNILSSDQKENSPPSLGNRLEAIGEDGPYCTVISNEDRRKKTHHTEQYLVATFYKVLSGLKESGNVGGFAIKNAAFTLDIATDLAPCNECVKTIDDFFNDVRTNLFPDNNYFTCRISFLTPHAKHESQAYSFYASEVQLEKDYKKNNADLEKETRKYNKAHAAKLQVIETTKNTISENESKLQEDGIIEEKKEQLRRKIKERVKSLSKQTEDLKTIESDYSTYIARIQSKQAEINVQLADINNSYLTSNPNYTNPEQNNFLFFYANKLKIAAQTVDQTPSSKRLSETPSISSGGGHVTPDRMAAVSVNDNIISPPHAALYSEDSLDKLRNIAGGAISLIKAEEESISENFANPFNPFSGISSVEKDNGLMSLEMGIGQNILQNIQQSPSNKPYLPRENLNDRLDLAFPSMLKEDQRRSDDCHEQDNDLGSFQGDLTRRRLAFDSIQSSEPQKNIGSL